jgi:CheY-like chemotaxis protein
MRDIMAFSLGLDSAIEVASCESGSEAIVLASDRAPDIILCDVRMPGMDGAELLARLRENPITAKIPFIFVTANARSLEIEMLKALGSVGVITKPFEPTAIAGAVLGYLRLTREHED